MRTTVALLLAASPASLIGQTAAAPIRPADLMRHVAVLAHDSLEGRLIGSPGGAKARTYLLRQFAAVGLQPVGSSLEHPFAVPNPRDSTQVRRGVNIVGVVRGRTTPERYIVVTAHYDHVGIRNGEVFNGADDNASGAGALVELARQLRASQPANSVLIVALDGEESGLLGAREFVRAPPVPASSTVLNVNLDMVGRNEKRELWAAGTSHYPFLRSYLDGLATRSGVTLRMGHDDPNGPRGDDWTSQSDHGAFHRAGIPFVYFGVEDHPDYHRATDETDRLMPDFYAAAVNTVLDAIRTFDRNLGAIAAARRAPVRLLTFNIRYGTARDSDHVWPNRRAHVAATIRDHAPHILGIQEALRFQLDELATLVPGYREIGVGRDDGVAAGEYAALLVDTTRYAVVSSGWFWFSDTPNVPGSKHWGNNVTRLCTWARLADRISGDTVRAYNVHWDHESQPSREKSAALLLERIARDGSPGDALLVFGDFNSDESNPAFRALVGANTGLLDTYRAVHPDAAYVGTFNSFRGDSTQGKIDAILAGPGWQVTEASIDRRRWGALWASDHFAVAAVVRRTQAAAPQFVAVQPNDFARGGTLVNAWSDFDNDGDQDLFVGFNGEPNRLYRNGPDGFVDVAAAAGIADARATRAGAWGDFDADGNVDLLVGFAPGTASTLKLYRNVAGRFYDVTEPARLSVTGGAVRQLSWIDFDGDDDLDLFVAYRDRPNSLYVNEAGTFTNVAAERGLADTRRAVGAVWFDYDQDGDLDVLVTNMDGDANALYRNDGGRFADQLLVRWGGRRAADSTNGTVRPCAADVNGDGRFDVFFANYGANGLFLNRGGGQFEDVSTAWGIAIDGRYDACAFADYDNDGQVDLYVNGTYTGGRNYPDYLFHNTGSRFDDVTPANIRALQADHGVEWADFDRDGAVDLSLTGARPDGMHLVLRNVLADSVAARSLSVLVTDARGRLTRAGAEVRLYAAGTQRLIGAQLVDTGSGYNAQNSGPVHFGLGATSTVDVEVTFPRGGTRQITRILGVDARAFRGKNLVVRMVPGSGNR